MHPIGEHILGITAAAIIGALLIKLSGEQGSNGGIIKLLCGVFLLLTIIQPLDQINWNTITTSQLDFGAEAKQLALQGEMLSRNSMRQIIKEQCEAYILDKAKDMGIELAVNVQLSNEDVPVPEAVFLNGRISPREKDRLSSIIEQGLGLSKEDQKWS